MKKIIITILMLVSTSAFSAEYWTVKANNGVMVTASGVAAINIGDFIPSGPNPSDAQWVDCYSNWIYFHSDSDGNLVDEKYVDRMLSVALAAYKTGSDIRIALTRSDAGRCYTSQIFD